MPDVQHRNLPLTVGEPAPWFTARCTSNAVYHFNTVAGRCVVMSFFGSAGEPAAQRVLAGFLEHAAAFDDFNACFFGVSIDPEDETLARVQEWLPGYRYLWDADLAVSRQFGAVATPPGAAASNAQYRRMTVVLDPRLRVLGVFPLKGAANAHVAEVMAFVHAQDKTEAPAPAALQAPVLVVPRIFEPALCRRLIDYYDALGGRDSGFVRDVQGKTVLVVDHEFKRRSDQTIEDDELRKLCMVRIHDRLAPEILKAFQFHATRMERYIIARYESEAGGFFRPHRDNTTKGTAHRKFAVTINLNTPEYEGGALSFPEYGTRTYAAPAGGAVVFSCALLHEALPVTRGVRYAFLPFLYDDAAAELRERNRKFLDSSLGA